MFSDHLLRKKGQFFFPDTTQLHHYYSHSDEMLNCNYFCNTHYQFTIYSDVTLLSTLIESVKTYSQLREIRTFSKWNEANLLFFGQWLHSGTWWVNWVGRCIHFCKTAWTVVSTIITDVIFFTSRQQVFRIWGKFDAFLLVQCTIFSQPTTALNTLDSLMDGLKDFALVF